jgi:hypothetical protein
MAATAQRKPFSDQQFSHELASGLVKALAEEGKPVPTPVARLLTEAKTAGAPDNDLGPCQYAASNTDATCGKQARWSHKLESDGRLPVCPEHAWMCELYEVSKMHEVSALPQRDA